MTVAHDRIEWAPQFGLFDINIDRSDIDRSDCGICSIERGLPAGLDRCVAVDCSFNTESGEFDQYSSTLGLGAPIAPRGQVAFARSILASDEAASGVDWARREKLLATMRVAVEGCWWRLESPQIGQPTQRGTESLGFGFSTQPPMGRAPMADFTDSVVEQAALIWLEALQ